MATSKEKLFKTIGVEQDVNFLRLTAAKFVAGNFVAGKSLLKL